MLDFADIRIRESVYLTVPKEIQVRRTWNQRLFSWPWKPWKTTQTVTIQVPNPDALLLPDGSYVMHPETAKRLRSYLITLKG